MGTTIPSTVKIDPRLAQEQLWRRGHLSWMLDPNQKELYELYYQSEHRVQTWLLARRSGKSYALCVLAVETCLRKPNSIVKFLAPTRVQVSLIIRPLMNKVLKTCPGDLQPEYKAKDNIYYFPNGSELQLSGSDGGSAERLRGGDSDLAIVDEAGSCSDLSSCVKDILLPTTLITRGKIILASTPPEDQEHDFMKFIEEAEQRGSIVIKTIDDNPRIAQKEKDDLIKELGGPNSDSTLRELYCKRIQSSGRTVFKEFTEEKAVELVKDWETPPHYDAFVSMDVGFKDWTAVLFGYYDFVKDKIIIQDEIITHGKDMYLPKLAKDIEQKESDLWTNYLTNEKLKPRKRVSDHDLIVQNEIKKHSNYRIFFENADKRDRMAGINFVRTLITSNRLIINPRCKVLISHLKNCKWASETEKDSFARCPAGSHYDAAAALVYFCRAIDFKRNPYPREYTGQIQDYMSKQFNFKPGPESSGGSSAAMANAEIYRKLLNRKK